MPAGFPFRTAGTALFGFGTRLVAVSGRHGRTAREGELDRLLRHRIGSFR
jgi:hypothetical protein